MYLDTSNVQSLKEKLLLCAVNEFAEYGYEGARVDNIVKAAGCSKQTVIITLVIKKIYLLKYWNIPGTIFDKKKRPLISQIFRHKKPLRKLLIYMGYYIANPCFLKIVLVKIKVKVCIMQNHSVS